MKAKNMSREEYVKEFCHDRRIRDRRVVYVSDSTHKKLKRIADLFQGEYQTVASLTDAIITHHIRIHHGLLSRLDEEDIQETLAWLSRPKEQAPEGEDEYVDDPAEEQ